MRIPFAALMKNRISWLGLIMVEISVILLLTLFAIEFFGFEGNPYLGVFTYMILPGGGAGRGCPHRLGVPQSTQTD
jgi:hypothetical protein